MKGTQGKKGFTLLELMVVVMIITILAAIAIPSYQQYGRRAARSAAQQEMLKLAEQLERHKGKNFSYRGFNPAYLYGSTDVMTSLALPVGATGSAIQYNLTLVDTSQSTTRPLAEETLGADETSALGLGLSWAIRADRNENNGLLKDRGDNILLTSNGVRCMTNLALDSVTELGTYTGCGANEAKW